MEQSVVHGVLRATVSRRRNEGVASSTPATLDEVRPVWISHKIRYVGTDNNVLCSLREREQAERGLKRGRKHPSSLVSNVVHVRIRSNIYHTMLFFLSVVPSRSPRSFK